MTIQSATAAEIQRDRAFAYSSLETIDADQHSIAVAECEHVYEQVERGAFRGRVSELLLGPVHILRDQVSNPIGYMGPAWVGKHVFFSFLPTAGTVYCHGRPIPQNAVVKYPRDFHYRAYSNGPMDCVAVSIREDAFVGELAAFSREQIPSLKKALCVPDHDCVVRFRRDSLQLLEEISAVPQLVEDNAWRESAKNRVLATLLEVVQSGTAAPHKLPPPSTRSYIVDKAIEFMQAKAACRPGELADLCRGLRVSSRTLRYSFQEIVGVSPVQYLFALKLRRIRRELLEGQGAHGIHRVAERHGFEHMGRFARLYQQTFGEKPSATVGRAAAGARAVRVRPVMSNFRRAVDA